MNLTPEQESAIYIHDKNLIVVAGAGSGKTHVLVERYLALLEANPAWPLNALVAITFTKKAAGEMRDRVRSKLQDRLRSAGDERSRWRWLDLLSQMDSARIDTIHGLCASILRANAAQAGVDPAFEVMEEADAKGLLDDVVKNVLRLEVGTDGPALALLTTYQYSRKQIHAVLSNTSLLAQAYSPLPDDPVKYWHDIWEKFVGEQIAVFKHRAETIGTYDPPDDDVLGHSWQTALRALARFYENPISLTACVEALGNIKGVGTKGGKKANWGGEETRQAARAALTALRDAAEATVNNIGSLRSDEQDTATYQVLHLWVALLRRVKDAYTAAKAARSVLDFDDLETLTKFVLLTYPDVQARYRGAEFKHLMVDEFQDTNAVQWEIIQALADLNKGGALFVVGDPKQSIYQFRGADVSVFGQVQQQIIRSGGQSVPLARSFRTHQPLVGCFNAVFSRVMLRNQDSMVKDFEVVYEDLMTAARDTPPGEGPFVELLLMDKTRMPKASAEDGRRWEAYEIARRLREMVENGVMIFDKTANIQRPVQYGDMALLFQSMTNITLYEDVFKLVGLPFITIAGRGYYNRQEVWDLHNLLLALHNPADMLSLAAALRSPLFNLSDNLLLRLRWLRDANNETVSLWDALQEIPDSLVGDEAEAVSFAARCLRELRALSGRVTIAELLREALKRTGYLAILTSLPDGARRRGNVEKLLEMAHTRGRVTLGTFSHYLLELSEREVREGEALLEGTGAVTLMTVHASKGLEFPVVGLVDTTWQRGSVSRDSDIVLFDPAHGFVCKVFDETKGNGVFEKPFSYHYLEQLQEHKETAERKRLFYVAATRAQDYLLVSGQVDVKDGRWTAQGWLAWLGDSLQINMDSTDDVEPILLTYDWGQVRLFFPEYIPDIEDHLMPVVSLTGWDILSDNLPQGVQPDLLQNIAVEWGAPARHLTATQIADVGSAYHAADDSERILHRDRVRRKLLHDAPAMIPSLRGRRSGISGRQLGEIVHDSVRYWRFPTAQDNLETLLESYAWEHGITDAAHMKKALADARNLLRRFTNSDVYRWVNAAQSVGRPVYRELPFIYKTDRRIIHGVIDLLFQQEDGTWTIIDYKTSAVSKNPTREAIRTHAKRYHLQVGVYAAAVQAQLRGLVPRTYIHYIRYGVTVEVETAQWRTALESLEALIGNIVLDED